MRPAGMIGTEDRILNTWAHFVKNYGFVPLIGDGSTKYVFIIFFCFCFCFSFEKQYVFIIY